MRTACKVVGVLAAPLLGACASGAQRNEVLASRPALAREPAAAAATAAVSTTAAAAATAADHDAAPNAELIQKGYQVMKRGGKLLYCRSERTTGSLIPTTACLTESQIRWLEQQNAQQSRDLQSQPRGGRNCPRGNCSDNGG